MKDSKIYFFQKYKDKPIFYNDRAMIVVELNENELVSYTQTMLTDLKEMGESENETARNYYCPNCFRKSVFKNKIHGNTHVKEAQIGYANLTASTSNNQVLAPTWNLKRSRSRTSL